MALIADPLRKQNYGVAASNGTDNASDSRADLAESDKLSYKQTCVLHLRCVEHLMPPVQLLRLWGNVGWTRVRFTATDISIPHQSATGFQLHVFGPCNIEGEGLTKIGSTCFIKPTVARIVPHFCCGLLLQCTEGGSMRKYLSDVLEVEQMQPVALKL